VTYTSIRSGFRRRGTPTLPARPNATSASNPRPLRLFRAALATSLAVSAVLFFVWSWHWPLLGDSSIIHYICFLIQRGWTPYSQISDQQFPGTYLIETAAMHLFGPGALAWRLFDFALLGTAAIAYCIVTRPSSLARGESWLPGLFTASLFILIHGRDGLAQGGQRDLTMAVLLIAATAALFAAMRRNFPSLFAVFGLLSGIAITIKPTTLPITLAQVALAAFVLSRRGSPWRPYLLPAALTYLIAPAIALTFLLREHALAAFLAGFHTIVPYYASLGHRPPSYILLHSISPMQPLVGIWFVLLALRGRSPHQPHDWERTTLLVGALFGLIDCLIQQRAFPYYRYPLLAFLLPLMAIDLDRALRQLTATPAPASLRARTASLLAVAGLCFGGFFLAPQSALFIHRYRWWETDFITSLEQNLQALGGSHLSGHIQCIDSISGCDNVLYSMRLVQSTGILADYVLFGSDTVPVIRETRQQFLPAMLADPPQVMVVTSPLHIDGPGNFQKLALWPAFDSFLATRYSLKTQWTPTRTARWWTREETPASYRIYVLRPNPAHPSLEP
jgi:hypothetical protein